MEPRLTGYVAFRSDRFIVDVRKMATEARDLLPRLHSQNGPRFFASARLQATLPLAAPERADTAA